jgi:hypothetical protein
LAEDGQLRVPELPVETRDGNSARQLVPEGQDRVVHDDSPARVAAEPLEVLHQELVPRSARLLRVRNISVHRQAVLPVQAVREVSVFWVNLGYDQICVVLLNINIRACNPYI